MSGGVGTLSLSPVTLARQSEAERAGMPGKGDLKGAAEAFEGILLGQMMATMRSTVPHSGLFGESETTRSTYDYLMDQAVIDKAIKGGRGLGLAAHLERSWARSREAQVPPGSGNPAPVPINSESR